MHLTDCDGKFLIA